MNSISIEKYLDSETVHLPEVKSLIGKTVRIIVMEQQKDRAAAEQEWHRFFAENGPIDIDPDAYRQQRQFDRDHATDHSL